MLSPGKYFFSYFKRNYSHLKHFLMQNKNFLSMFYPRTFALNKPKLTFMIFGVLWVLCYFAFIQFSLVM